jgi:predicted DNA-binding transcriptional regulator AlpA
MPESTLSDDKTFTEIAASPRLPHSSTLTEVGKRHGVGRSLMYELLASGRGPRTIKIGERTRVTDIDEVEWIERLRQEAAERDGSGK